MKINTEMRSDDETVKGYVLDAQADKPTLSSQDQHRIALVRYFLDTCGVTDPKERAAIAKPFMATVKSFGSNDSALQQHLGLRKPGEKREKDIEKLVEDV
jgi:hypothetical protein